MEISNKFFNSVLIERLRTVKDKLMDADDSLYFKGITTYEGFHGEENEKYKIISRELENKYPDVNENLGKNWRLVRDSMILINELIEGIEYTESD